MQWCLRLLLEPFSIVIVTLGETFVGDLVYLHKVVSYLVIQQCDTIRIRYVSSSYFQGNSIHTYIHTYMAMYIEHLPNLPYILCSNFPLPKNYSNVLPFQLLS